MKTRQAVNVFVLYVLLTLVAFIRSLAAMEVVEPPEVVTLDGLQALYEAVEFDHAMHMEISDCRVCHHHTTGGGSENPRCSRCHANSGLVDQVGCTECHGETPDPVSTPELVPYHIDKPGLKGAWHLLCVDCHQVEGGPTDCQDCHAFTEKGKNIFCIHDEKPAGSGP